MSERREDTRDHLKCSYCGKYCREKKADLKTKSGKNVSRKKVTETANVASEAFLFEDIMYSECEQWDPQDGLGDRFRGLVLNTILSILKTGESIFFL